MKTLLLIACLTVAGCTSVVLQKARLQPVRRVVVASLFADKRIPEIRGQGVLKKIEDDTYLEIAEDALTAFETAFKDLGWDVLAPDEFVETPAYKAVVARAPAGKARTSGGYGPRYFQPVEMTRIWLEGDVPPEKTGRRLQKTERDLLVEVLEQSEADAIALLALRFCFRTYERNRAERAVITAASQLQLVDRRGHILVQTDAMDGCGEGARGESRTNMPIESEDWVFDPMKREEFRKLFREASQAEAVRLVGALPVTPMTRSHR